MALEILLGCGIVLLIIYCCVGGIIRYKSDKHDELENLDEYVNNLFADNLDSFIDVCAPSFAYIGKLEVIRRFGAKEYCEIADFSEYDECGKMRLYQYFACVGNDEVIKYNYAMMYSVLNDSKWIYLELSEKGVDENGDYEEGYEEYDSEEYEESDE